ncbi:MAG TPA: hypothetical protein PKK60_01780 [archaeon]|nr:hypothetical protein [archaeon]
MEKFLDFNFRNISVLDLKNPAFCELSSASVREQVISLIGFQPGLSCIQLTKIINSLREKKVTNQAVFHLLNELAIDGVLLKKDKKYFVNLEWISKLKNAISEIEEKSILSHEQTIILC